MNLQPFQHCHFCGTAYTTDAWPRQCAACQRLTYRNPLPVAVVLQPVDDGVLVVRRGIEPQKGQLALPGGYMDYNESFAEAAARELWEETGFRANSDAMQLFEVASARNNTLLVFVLAQPIRQAQMPPWTPNAEVTELAILREPQPLAFNLHTQMVAKYFAQQRAPRNE